MAKNSKILIGKKIFLREMTIDDSKYIVNWRNDDEILKWMFNREKITFDSHIKWFKNRKNRIDYLICEIGTEKPIGSVNFNFLDKEYVEAGKMLGDKKYWGGGYAKEAFILWLNYGFNFLKIKNIYVQTKINNKSNIGLNMNLGFIENKTMKNKISKEDFIFMSVNKEKFKYYNEK